MTSPSLTPECMWRTSLHLTASVTVLVCPCCVVAQDYTQGEVDGALKELGFSKEQVYKF